MFTAPRHITSSRTLSLFPWNLQTHKTRDSIFGNMDRILIGVYYFIRGIFVLKSMNI